MQHPLCDSKFPVPEGFSVLELPESSLWKWLFGCFSVLLLIGWWAGLDCLILKNNVAFMICILYKELKDLSGLLQKSAHIAQVLGRISSNESEIWRAESCLEQRWREVTTDLARYSCSVCLHSIFYMPLYSGCSQTPLVMAVVPLSSPYHKTNTVFSSAPKTAAPQSLSFVCLQQGDILV